MLVVAQYIVRVKVSHYIAVYYVLQEFTCYGRKGHWPIVRCLVSVALLEWWDY